MRKCGRCKKSKKIDSFYWKNKDKGIKASICKECQKIATAKNYLKHRDVYIAQAHVRNAAHRKVARAMIDEARSIPCTDCKGEFPAVVMQFDHVNGNKEMNVADTIRGGWSMSRIQKEMNKCEVVCANCHAIRTWVT